MCLLSAMGFRFMSVDVSNQENLEKWIQYYDARSGGVPTNRILQEGLHPECDGRCLRDIIASHDRIKDRNHIYLWHVSNL